MSNETVQRWFLKFGRLIAVNLRCSRPRAGALASRGDGHGTCGSERTRASPGDFLSGGCAFPRRRERAGSHRSNLAMWLMPQDGVLFLLSVSHGSITFCLSSSPRFGRIRTDSEGVLSMRLRKYSSWFSKEAGSEAMLSARIRSSGERPLPDTKTKKGARFWTPGPLPLREVT